MQYDADTILLVTGIVSLLYLCAGAACLAVEHRYMRLISRATPQERCGLCVRAMVDHAEFHMQISDMPWPGRWVVHFARLLTWPVGVVDHAASLPPLHRCTRIA